MRISQLATDSPSARLLLLSTPLYYALYSAIGYWGLGVIPHTTALWFDFTLALLLSAVVHALSRSAWSFCLVQGLLLGLLQLGNAIKISVFGGPIRPDDVFALSALLRILDGWQLIAACSVLGIPLLVLLYQLELRKRASWLAVALLCTLGSAWSWRANELLTPLDHYFGNNVWSQYFNYLDRGPLLYSLQEGTRHFATRRDTPQLAQVQQAADQLLRTHGRTLTRPYQARNVHLILLESFWDPSALQAAGFNRDPLSAEFRQLWNRAGRSTILSPVFGGYTANAEYEALCGFPVEEDAVQFERRVRNSVACLPRILSEQGYRSVASHPNVAAFWNRSNVYPRVGFQERWFQEQFQSNDMNGDFLGDRSYYQQVLTKLQPPPSDTRPVFNYMVTIFGHLDFPRNEQRPTVVQALNSQVPEVQAYANIAYYKSLELVELIEQLHAQDPEALIVAFGDHLPFLGGQFAGYQESGLLPAEQTEFSATNYRTFVSTPLLVIDGQRGPLKVGHLPLYRLPHLMLELLGYRQPNILQFAAPQQRYYTRPLPGLHLNLHANGQVELCRGLSDDPASCQWSHTWLAQLRTLGRDLFEGKQYALRIDPPESDAQDFADLEQNLLFELLESEDAIVVN